MTQSQGRVRAIVTAHPARWDVALALVVALACVSASDGLRPYGALFLLLACGAVVFRRRAPFPGLLVVACALCLGVVVCCLVGEVAPWGYLAGWIMLFHTARHRPGTTAPAASVAGVLALASFAGAAGTATFADRWDAFVPVAAMNAVAVLAGVQLRNVHESAVRRREEAARAAVAVERSRISREIHDLIGHDLSVIASLSAGGETAVRSCPADAERAFAAIGEVSRASVGQLRHVLRLLRTPHDAAEASLAPQPGLAELGALIESVRDAGLRVDEERHGDHHELPLAHQLAVYRVVQEALTNVLRHGGEGTAVTVKIAVDAPEVMVMIADRGALPGAYRPAFSGEGHGIIGMRERIDALGGTLNVGPTAAGWLVRAVIPRNGDGM